VVCAAGVLLLMALIAWTPGVSFTEDLGRHLLLGRIISEQHAVPETNLLTYTYPDFPFVNHHWLSEVFLYHAHRLIGLNGLIVWKMIMLTGTLGLALWTKWPSRGIGIYYLAGLLAAVILGSRAHIRPELFTYFGVAFYGWAFRCARAGAAWPKWAVLGYALFWANAHIYFVFGLGMAGAFFVERWTTRGSTPSRDDVVWLAALVLVSCINPNGISGLLYPFRIFSSYGADVTENMSPLECWQTVVNPMLIALPMLSVMTVGAVIGCLRSRTWHLADLVIALAALVAAWTMARSTPLLALAAPPVIGAWLGSTRSEARGRPRDHRRWHARSPVRRAAAAGVLAVATITNIALVRAVWSGAYQRVFPSPLAPTPFGFDDERKYLALMDLKRDGLGGPVFSNYNIGSLVEYNLYPERGYVDNRPEAFPPSFWREEYLPALALGTHWEQIRERRGFNAIVVSFTGVKEAYTRELMRRPNWVLVHLDFVLGVWVRKRPESEAFIEAHRLDGPRMDALERSIATRIDALSDEPAWRRHKHAQEILYALYALHCVGESPRVWPHLWRLHRLLPDYQMVHEMLRVSVPPAHIADVNAVIARRARWPVAAKQVTDWGRVLESDGKIEQAKAVYRRGRWFFPLSKHIAAAAQRLGDRH
jgi:hypothetical protein